MKIYSMKATFGKLEHQELVLESGLNVIHAPNEWGKSTWCAFLLAMLYGLDSRGKTSKKPLPDKERFSPWTGLPMSGRMELCWDGRDITIERSTRGRIPMGYFRAYETHTGIPVPELTAANCGQMLLGVEQSVFRRAGFIRLTDLPVTQDEALRRRLNALVTTGDESGDAEKLEQQLRELKNRCRYNHSGLLPQADAQREELEKKLAEYQKLHTQLQTLQNELADSEEQVHLLNNHAASLQYAEAQTNAKRVEEAYLVWQQTCAKLELLEAQSAMLPMQEEAEAACEELIALRQQLSAAQQKKRMPPPMPPEVPACFHDLEPEDALEQAAKDTRRYQEADWKGWWLLLVLSLVVSGCGAFLMALVEIIPGAMILSIGLAGLLFSAFTKKKQTAIRHTLIQQYAPLPHREWVPAAEQFVEDAKQYEERLQNYLLHQDQNAAVVEELRRKQRSLCGSMSIDEALMQWQKAIRQHEQLDNLRREERQAKNQYSALQSMLRNAVPPSAPDHFSCSLEETKNLLWQHSAYQQDLRGQIAQVQTRLDLLGNPDQLQSQYQAVQQRIAELEQYNSALEIALSTLSKAKDQLQRRFAPRITQQAQAYLTALTGGKYTQLSIDADLGLRTAPEQAEILHEALWHSDGTMDQLYLAMRLAVAEELTPETPLILDDALVRFDDARLKAALDLLSEIGQTKQILLFSCQEREYHYIVGS